MTRILICGRASTDSLEKHLQERGYELVRQEGLPGSGLPAFQAIVLCPDAAQLASPTFFRAAVASIAARPHTLVAALVPPELSELVLEALRLGACDASVDGPQLAARLDARLEFTAPRALARTLPAPVSAPVELDSGATAAPPPKLILVCRDPEERERLCRQLERSFAVECPADVEEAIALAEQRPPALVVLDLEADPRRGPALLERLRRGARTERVPVLALCAAERRAALAELLELGAVDHLARPFSARELTACAIRSIRWARERERLLEIALTDALTGLPNFRAFRERLDDELKRARRYGTGLACVMVDLDDLKKVNDLLGHAAGNRAIISAAAALRAELRQTDFAARYGGDEFVVLLPHATEQEAATFAERVRARFRATDVGAEGAPAELRASFGIAAETGARAEPEDLLRRADAALYAAKRRGKGRVQLSSSSPAQQEPGRQA